ncbi:hypothetical protein PPYR_15701, partial [Photinus pyralis]
IVAATAVSFLSISVGLGTAYSAILIPQLSAAQRNKELDAITLTETEGVWFTSSVALVMPFAGVIAGVLTDNLGRLRVLQMSTLPQFIGWVIIATASNTWMLFAGRLVTGFAGALVIVPSMVYVSEISSPKIRGALQSISSTFYNAGLLTTYLKGWFLSWRVIAWLAVAYSVISLLCVLFIPESSVWLLKKGKSGDAQKSFEWFTKYRQKYESETLNESPQLQNMEIIKEEPFSLKTRIRWTLKQFALPTGYKPFLIMAALMVIQEFSGAHVIMMNAVIFFEGIGTNFDPYLASVYMATMRVGMAVTQIWLMRRFNRRALLMVSCVGMTICMIISAVYTKWIQDGSTTRNWVPLCMLILYFMFFTGLISIPLVVTTEVFPLPIRGLASNLISAILYIMLFGALQSFYPLYNALGGLSGVQYFYGLVSAVGFIFVFLFLPETHNKDLWVIERYFLHNTMYFSMKGKHLIPCH